MKIGNETVRPNREREVFFSDGSSASKAMALSCVCGSGIGVCYLSHLRSSFPSGNIFQQRHKEITTT